LREAEYLRARRIVVVVVEVLDDLIGPASLEHVAAHDVSPQRSGRFTVSELLEQMRAFLEEVVGSADQLMEGVEVAAGPLDILKRFGCLAHRVNRLGIIGGVSVRHLAPFLPARPKFRH
jgi:hypothetical protein